MSPCFWSTAQGGHGDLEPAAERLASELKRLEACTTGMGETDMKVGKTLLGDLFPVSISVQLCINAGNTHMYTYMWQCHELPCHVRSGQVRSGHVMSSSSSSSSSVAG